MRKVKPFDLPPDKMAIKIPNRHYKYVRMLVDAKVYPNEEIASFQVFKEGLDEAEFDATHAGGPDMGMDFLKGEKITIEVPYTPDQLKLLERISKRYEFPISKTLTVVFLQGLWQHYLALVNCYLYKMNKRFREKVDRMPHDTAYDGIRTL